MLAHILVLSSLALGPCVPEFEEEVRFDTGQNPEQIEVGDLDGDTFPDVVVGHFIGGFVSIFYGNGQGAFGIPVTLPAGAGGGVLIADLNHDNNPDIITANVLNDDISVILADGMGGFLEQTRFGAGDGPVTIAAADLNMDTHPDLVVSAGLDDTLRVFLGDGAGGLTPLAPITIDDLRQVVTGDFNADLIPDLAVPRSSVGLVDVLIGIGDGTFAPPVSYTATFGASYIDVGDLDANGTLDLVVVPRVVSVPPTDAALVVLLGVGDGTFAPPVAYTIGQRPSECVIVDIDNDGILDVVASNIDANELSVLHGVGDGTLMPQIRVPAGVGPASIAAADLVGDGVPDLLFLNANVNKLSVMLNTCPSLGCNAADLVEPFGTLDFSDVLAFLTAFGAGDPGADLAPPFGTLYFSDVLTFLTAFGAGCP